MGNRQTENVVTHRVEVIRGGHTHCIRMGPIKAPHKLFGDRDWNDFAKRLGLEENLRNIEIIFTTEYTKPSFKAEEGFRQSFLKTTRKELKNLASHIIPALTILAKAKAEGRKPRVDFGN